MKPIIYVVEDDEGICEVYEGAFEDGYQTKIFDSGTSFFAEFEKKRPDLIVLDIMLPDMDGYTILSKIRELDTRVPVIIVSAKSDEISFVKGLNKGADDYMAKPFSIMELLARVKTPSCPPWMPNPATIFPTGDFFRKSATCLRPCSA